MTTVNKEIREKILQIGKEYNLIIDEIGDIGIFIQYPHDGTYRSEHWMIEALFERTGRYAPYARCREIADLPEEDFKRMSKMVEIYKLENKLQELKSSL